MTFFLSSIDHNGYPTCSIKAGESGFLKIMDPKPLTFYYFDAYGMFLPIGNINTNEKIGLLLFDFEIPHRVRIHCTASMDKKDSLLKEFNGSEIVMRITITEIFVNFPRYIPTYQHIKTSENVPQSDFVKPLIPQWKRIDAVQDFLPERDIDIAA